MLDPEDIDSLLPWMVWHLEEPAGGEEVGYLFAAAREAARHVTLVLTGFGIDGLFGGSPGIGSPTSRSGTPRCARRSWSSTTMPSGVCLQPPSVVGRSGPRTIAAVTFPPRGSAERRRCRRFRPFFTVETSRCRSCSAVISWPCHTSLPIERLYAGAGIRLCAPHADPRFVDTAFSIPDRFKIRREGRQDILRRTCARMLPLAVESRRHGGDRVAHRLRWSDALEGMAVELLSPGAVLERGLFEPAYVTDLLRRARGQPYGEERSRRIWSLLLVEIWARAFLDRTGSAPAQAPPAVHRLDDTFSRAGPPGSTASARSAADRPPQ